MPDKVYLDDQGNPLKAAPTYLDEHGNEVGKPTDRGFLEGLKSTLPTPANVLQGLKQIPANIRQSLNPDFDAIIANRPNTPIGKVIGGRPREGAGELTGILGQLAASEAIPAGVRTATGGGPTIQGVSADALRKAGVGESAIKATSEGRTVAPPKPVMPWQGRSVADLKPIEAPPPAPPTNVAEAPVSQPLGQPRVMTLKPTPTSWTPEAARARIEYNDWHTGAEPGTPEAQSAHALHRFDAELQARMQHQIDNPNGYINYGLMRSMGLPMEVAKYPIAYRYMGVPGVGIAAGTDAARLIRAYPAESAQAARAALLANLALTNPTPVASHEQR